MVGGILVLSAVALLPGSTPPTAVSAAALIQPTLLRYAVQHPGAQVSVIVQESASATSLNNGMTALGGQITHDLSLIHAVALTVPARSITHLAQLPGVRYVSLDAPVVRSSYTCCTATLLQSVYPQTIGASSLWSQYQGQGIGVAVVDSGFAWNADLNANVVANINVNPLYHHHTSDLYGHGTHVAGIIGGNGTNSSGAYTGIAPQSALVNVRVADDNGASTVSDVVNGLQWVFNNASTYNIRVVNLSLNSTVASSYQIDPLDAGVEALWKAGIVVVVSAGNNGSTNAGVLFAPANDPFAITVGAVNDQGTVSQSDDTLASFSSYGTIPVSTTTGQTININKPDLVAPGMNIVSDEAGATTTLAIAHPDHIVTASNGCVCYFRMSGTSMAAPMVAGAVALLLQSNPSLTPDQVKYRLTATANPVAATTGVGTGEVNVVAAVASSSTASANQNLAEAASLQPGNPAANWTSANWGSANWGSANWGSANWGSANWGSANWGSANWGSDYWG